MTLTLNEEQIMIIRQAMCNLSTRYLTRAFEAEDELKKLGRTDRDAVEFEMNQHDICHKIIEMIDEARAN